MERPTLFIHMLGELSLSSGKHRISDSDNRSRKVWALIAYFIHARKRSLASSELIDLLWDDEEGSVNPANALKTMLHRARAFLDKLEDYSGQELILRQHNGYAWNKDVQCQVDTDAFEDSCKAGKAVEDRQAKLAFYRKAVSQYKGDFLPKLSGEHWVVTISAYYRQLYEQTIHELLQLLAEDQAHEEIISLCSQGLSVNPYDEELYYHQIQALVSMGNQKAAMACYEQMMELFFSKFGITPSERLQALYRQVARTSHNMEMDLVAIKDQLRENFVTKGAFFCEYEFFKDVYRIEARSASRNGAVIHLGLITAADIYGEPLPQRKLNLCMEKLRDVIQLSLRKGDVFSQYSPAQYIVMLPCANYENSCLVMERLIKQFKRENPHSSAMLRYSVQPLEPVE